MKRFILAALLTLPATLTAQADYYFTNYQNTSFGFSTTLQFRNSATYAAPEATAIGSTLRVNTSQRIQTYCLSFAEGCAIASPSQLYTIGSVQGDAVFDGQPWIQYASYAEDSCAGLYCMSQFYDGPVSGVFGCRVPVSPMTEGESYMGRTCAADGYDGWFAIDFNFYVYDRKGFVPGMWDASDLTAAFDVQRFAAAPIVTPEPGTVALLAFGLVVMGVARRWRAEGSN